MLHFRFPACGAGGVGITPGGFYVRPNEGSGTEVLHPRGAGREEALVRGFYGTCKGAEKPHPMSITFLLLNARYAAGNIRPNLTDGLRRLSPDVKLRRIAPPAPETTQTGVCILKGSGESR
jgi:hypothetical protein